MKAKHRQSGLTLMEMTVVIAVMAVLTVFSMPAIRTFTDSLTSAGSVENLISASLACARGIAAREQQYAGVRFQQNPAGSQYIIFIVHDQPSTGLANGFCSAIKGMKPIKLPGNIGVMDMKFRTDTAGATSILYDIINGNNDINDDTLRDTTSFSIIFSPSGKMVIHTVRIRNRDGYWDSPSNNSADDIFNKGTIVDSGSAMFYQDDYPASGLGQELSRNRFIIYDKEKFKQAYGQGTGYSGYLAQLKTLYINPYTGTIISAD